MTPVSARPQVIVGFRSSGTENALTPPVHLTEDIRKAEDYTGRVLQPGELFEVAHVDVSKLPESDYSVSLRLIPYDGPAPE